MPAIFILIASILLLGACSVTERVSYGDSEGAIPERLLEKVKKQETEKSWVLTHLGEPFSIDRVESVHENNDEPPATLFEVYTYRFTRSHIRSGHLLYVLRAGAREDDTQYYHVAFAEDIVQRTWLDDFPRAQLGERKRIQKIVTHVVTEKEEPEPEIDSTGWKIPFLKRWFSSKKEEEAKPEAKVMAPVPDQATIKEAVMQDLATSKMQGKHISEDAMMKKGAMMKKESMMAKEAMHNSTHNSKMQDKTMMSKEAMMDKEKMHKEKMMKKMEMEKMMKSASSKETAMKDKMMEESMMKSKMNADEKASMKSVEN